MIVQFIEVRVLGRSACTVVDYFLCLLVLVNNGMICIVRPCINSLMLL